MLVVCGRCETEYEFDDALLSERGTTVKCTNCGYQFKVRPPRGVAAGESWSVKRAAGGEVRFPSLRELRRAIDTGLVGMDDQLARDGGLHRRIRDVPELAALFRRRQPQPGHAQTLMGVGTLPESALPNRQGAEQLDSSRPTPEAPIEPPPTSLIDLGGAPRRTPVPRRPAYTPQGTPVAYESFSSEDRKSASFATVPPPPDEAQAQTRRTDLASTWTSPSHQTPVVEAPPAIDAPPTPVVGPPPAPPVVSAGVVPASAVQFASVPPPAPSSSPESQRPNMPPAPLSVPPPPRKAAGLRWVAGFVLLGGLALLAGTVGKDYLAQFVGGTSASSSAGVQALTEQGWELFRDGDLAATQAKFEEAAKLAQDDPAVMLGLIQLDLVRADVEWLRLRLLPESAEEERATSRKTLEAHLQSAQRAFSTIPRLPDTAERTALMETDALRLQGQYEQARSLVERFTFDPTDPHAAYVLAMLDVGEGSQAWSTVIERLRSALVSERALGRARSALIYALAASGDERLARLELTKLEDVGRSHPLTKELEAFIDTLAAGEEDSAEAAEGEDKEASATDAKEPAEPKGESGGGKGLVWLWLDKASAARRSGDLLGAKDYYQKVLDASPGNANGLAGLGAIARLQGKYQEAKRHFDDVLERSPNHLPALIGGADVRWLMGAKQGAVLLYKKVPESSPFYSHAQRRIAEFEGRSAGPSAPEPDSQGGASEEQGAGSGETQEPKPKAEPDEDEAPASDDAEEEAPASDDADEEEPTPAEKSAPVAEQAPEKSPSEPEPKPEAPEDD